MLFGNSHVKAPAGIAFGKQVQPRAIGHRGSHGANLVVPGGLLQQGIGKHAGIAGGVTGGLFLFAGDHVKGRHPMSPVTGSFGGCITLAFFGQHMDQHRPRGAVLDGAQQWQQLAQVMPINRADIGKAQLFEQCAANGHGFQHFLGALGPFLKRRGQQADRAFGGGFQFLKRLACVKA